MTDCMKSLLEIISLQSLCVLLKGFESVLLMPKNDPPSDPLRCKSAYYIICKIKSLHSILEGVELLVETSEFI